MKNNYFFSALCVITLVCAPACKKKHTTSKKNDIKTTIDISNAVAEPQSKETVAKF